MRLCSRVTPLSRMQTANHPVGGLQNPQTRVDHDENGGELTREEFEQANADLGAKVFELEDQQRALASKAATSNFRHIRSAPADGRFEGVADRRAGSTAPSQNLLFERGLEYSPESGYLNSSNCSLFSTIQTIGSSESKVTRQPWHPPKSICTRRVRSPPQRSHARSLPGYGDGNDRRHQQQIWPGKANTS
jgi:hypothetical protein